jgi:hypothetical protein
MRKSSGTQLDPDLVEAFVTMDFTDFDRMLNSEEAPPAPPTAIAA